MLAPSQFPRNRITVGAWMAEMDRQRGARIQQLRLSRSLTREQLAPKLGVTVKTVYNWEKGHEINPTNLKALAEFFDVEIDYIRAGELETPDLLGVNAEDGRLGRLERDMGDVKEILAEILERLERMDATRAGRAASAARQANQRKTPESQRKPPAKKRRQAGG